MAEKDNVVVQTPIRGKGRQLLTWRKTLYGIARDDYQESPLKDLCSDDDGVQTGPFGSQLHQKDYVAIGTPIITVEHLGENRITHEGLPCVADADRERLSKYILSEGDIVFSRVGSVDRRALVREAEEGWLFSGRCLRVRPDKGKVDPTYLSYFFGLPVFQEYIRSIAVGATMPSLNTQILSSVPILHPPLEEQRAIAHVLGTLDDKIELNRRMNETLEDMARALFKSWFVDFEPVRAKMDGRWRRGESLPGLPAEHYDLFPDRLVASELGDIPEGWAIGQLSDVATQLRDNENPEVSSDIVFSHFSIPAYDEGQTPKRELGGSIKSTKSRVFENTVLLSKLNPEINRVWLVDMAPNERAICSTEFLVLEAKPPFRSSYVYCLVLSPFFRQQIQSIVTGTSKSHQRAPADAVLSLKTLIPDERAIEAFVSPVSGLFRHNRTLRRESRALAALRDALLPRLVSGNMKVQQD